MVTANSGANQSDHDSPAHAEMMHQRAGLKAEYMLHIELQLAIQFVGKKIRS